MMVFFEWLGIAVAAAFVVTAMIGFFIVGAYAIKGVFTGRWNL